MKLKSTLLIGVLLFTSLFANAEELKIAGPDGRLQVVPTDGAVVLKAL